MMRYSKICSTCNPDVLSMYSFRAHLADCQIVSKKNQDKHLEYMVELKYIDIFHTSIDTEDYTDATLDKIYRFVKINRDRENTINNQIGCIKS